MSAAALASWTLQVPKRKKKVRRNEVNSCVGTGPLVLDCVSSHNAGKLWPAGVVIAARRIHDYFASIVF